MATEDVSFDHYTTVTWEEYPRLVRVEVGSKFIGIFTVGDYVTFDGRNGSGVLLLDIYGDEKGPKGLTYLPFRDENDRWATPLFSLKGDPRFIICIPHGVQHYGQHIRWETLVKIGAPTTEIFREKVDLVKKLFEEKIHEQLATKP